ncbi:MAG: ECF transporter S component [Lachnospiraceae bacterium]|nr:ECF transporter S component [Lachnospiraceae bacterium]
MNDKLKQVVTASVLAAFTTVATMIIKVPTLGTNGYVNIGDSVVLLCAWLLQNPYGALAAGVGSALADLLSGYPAYIPGTAVIKFAMAFVCAVIFSKLANSVPKVAAYVISSIVAELIMVTGYFLYEAFVLGYGLAAAASIISNGVQALTCLVIGNALIHALDPVFRKFQLISVK